MLKLNINNIGDLAIVECEGRIVRSEAAFKLRDAVTAQMDARTVVLELTEVPAIEGGDLGIAPISAAMGSRSRHPVQAVQSMQICV